MRINLEIMQPIVYRNSQKGAPHERKVFGFLQGEAHSDQPRAPEVASKIQSFQKVYEVTVLWFLTGWITMASAPNPPS